MEKSALEELFLWNLWANQKHREVLSSIPFDDLKQETPYGKLLDRIIHIFASFKMWYQRMEGKSPDNVLNSDDFNSWNELSIKWAEYDQLLVDYVKNITDDKLDSIVQYRSLDGNWYQRRVLHILIHLTTHPNYHRGQITAILKERNLANFPSVDPVFYYLETGEALKQETTFNE